MACRSNSVIDYCYHYFFKTAHSKSDSYTPNIRRVFLFLFAVPGPIYVALDPFYILFCSGLDHLQGTSGRENGECSHRLHCPVIPEPVTTSNGFQLVVAWSQGRNHVPLPFLLGLSWYLLQKPYLPCGSTFCLMSLLPRP